MAHPTPALEAAAETASAGPRLGRRSGRQVPNSYTAPYPSRDRVPWWPGELCFCGTAHVLCLRVSNRVGELYFSCGPFGFYRGPGVGFKVRPVVRRSLGEGGEHPRPFESVGPRSPGFGVNGGLAKLRYPGAARTWFASPAFSGDALGARVCG